MKKQIILTMLSLSALNVAAQDIIVMKNGDEVEAKVTKVGTTEVEYHKWSNQDGPVYTAAKSDVFMIKYKNGEKDVFNKVPEQSNSAVKSESSAPQYVEAVPAANNQELISMYNQEINTNLGEQNGKKEVFCTPVLGVASTSIMSTDEVEVRIVPKIIEEHVLGELYYYLRYGLEIKNKTDKLLYIDLANSFRIDNKGISESYYKQESTTVSNGSSSGAGLNLGAVSSALGIGGTLGTLASGTTVGGSSQGAVSTTYSNNRVLTIAPHSKQFLTEHKEVHVKKDNYIVLSDIEHYTFIMSGVPKNAVESFTENESPLTTKNLITYSTSADFSNYSSLKINLYVRRIIGTGKGLYAFRKGSAKSLLKSICKIFPGYNINSNILIGGNYYGSEVE